MSESPTTCPICYNEYDNEKHIPKMILPCGHSICSFCLGKILRTRKCPIDRQKFIRTLRKIADFPKNTTVLGLIEEFKHYKSQLCDKHKEPKTFVCLTDQIRICGACSRLEHKRHNCRHIEEIREQANKKKVQLQDIHQEITTRKQKTQSDILTEKLNYVEDAKYYFGELHQDLYRREEEFFSEIGLFLARKKLKAEDEILKMYPETHNIEKEIADLASCNFTPYFYKALLRQQPKIEIINLEDDLCFLDRESMDISQILKEDFSTIRTTVNNVIKRFSPILPLGRSDLDKIGPAVKFEHQSLKESLLESFMVLNKVDEELFITPRSSQESESLKLSDPIMSSDLNKIKTVNIAFHEKEAPIEFFQALYYIWPELSSMKHLCVSFSGISGQDPVKFHLFDYWDFDKITHFSLKLEECTEIATEEVLSWVSDELIPKMKNTRAFQFHLGNSNLKDDSLELLTNKALTGNHNLQALGLRLYGNALVTDKNVKELFAKMREDNRNIRIFDLQLGSTSVTDNGVKGLNDYLLSSKCEFDGFKLSLKGLPVTDARIVELSEALQLKTRNTINFYLDLSRTHISDYSLLALTKNTLRSMDKLSFFYLNVCGLRGEESTIQLFFLSMKDKFQSLEALHLDFSDTNLADVTLNIFSSHVLPMITKLKCLELYLSSTSITDSSIMEFFNKLTKIAATILNLKIYFDHTAITKRSVETLFEQVLPASRVFTTLEVSLVGAEVTKKDVESLILSLRQRKIEKQIIKIILTDCEINNNTTEEFGK